MKFAVRLKSPVMPQPRLVAFIAILYALMTGQCVAQEFRIFTRVYDETLENKEPVSRSLTLFHAGRVYDSIDSIGEVTIFEPGQRRFIVLNTRLNVKTIVTIREIKQLMASARRVARKRKNRLAAAGDATASATARILAFQLEPQFREAYDTKTKLLKLASEFVQYEAGVQKVEMKEVSDAYREYADWIVRLNFILHPRPLLPPCRMALNAALARQQAIPISVKLTVNTRPRLRLRADHRVHWTFDGKDRDSLGKWDSLLKSKAVRELPLREYQRRLGIRQAGK